MAIFGQPKPKYDPGEERSFRGDLERFLSGFFQRNASIEMSPRTFIYMRSSSGERWQISVSDAGALVVTPA